LPPSELSSAAKASFAPRASADLFSWQELLLQCLVALPSEL